MAKASTSRKPASRRLAPRVARSAGQVIAELRALGVPATRSGMARFGIEGKTASRAFGVSVGELRALAKRLGPDHTLAKQLFKSGWYEAQMLAAFVGEPDKLTPAMMTNWAKAFDNWATCDTACFHLFDKAEPALAFNMVKAWAKRDEEFVKRAAFALLASIALHNKKLPDSEFDFAFALVENAATDNRNFVKKGVNWALRALGKRSPRLLAKATKTAERLAESESAAARWVGNDALREFAKRAK